MRCCILSGKLVLMTQDDAFKLLTMGKNVFLTGAAGSGKTFLLNRYIHWLRERSIEPAITASTGIAATHINGQTIHSWSGIGIKDHLSAYDIDRIEQNERLVKRFDATQVIIIDEVSMLSANTLDMVDKVLRAGTRTYEPFGGKQVVLCGDFFQLPPVVRSGGDTPFAFAGSTWNDLQLHVCYLTQQYRQEGGILLELLNNIRSGMVTDEQCGLLEKRVGTEAPDNIPHLYTHNVDVDKLNNERLAALPGTMKHFTMRTKGSKKRVEMIKKTLLVPEVLQLKKGAAVMFVKNHPAGMYVNGTLGTVTNFRYGAPRVQTRDGRTIDAEPESWRIEEGDTVKAEVTQVPLRLAWAVTIHKSQGMTLNAARIDLSKTFVPGQGYVALSRIRSLEGVFLEGISNLAYARHPAVAATNETFTEQSEQLIRRIDTTPTERFEVLAKEFIASIGGHEPDPNAPKPRKKSKQTTYEKTLALIRNERTLLDIITERGVTESTIITHLEKLLMKGTLNHDDIQYLRPVDIDTEEFDMIVETFQKSDTWNLSPVRTQLKKRYSYDQLRLVRLFIRPWKDA